MKKVIKLTENDISRIINEVLETMNDNGGKGEIMDIRLSNALEDAIFDFCENHHMENVARNITEEVKEAVSNILRKAVSNMRFLNSDWEF